MLLHWQIAKRLRNDMTSFDGSPQTRSLPERFIHARLPTGALGFEAGNNVRIEA